MISFQNSPPKSWDLPLVVGHFRYNCNFLIFEDLCLLRKEWNPIRFTGYPETALNTARGENKREKLLPQPKYKLHLFWKGEGATFMSIYFLDWITYKSSLFLYVPVNWLGFFTFDHESCSLAKPYKLKTAFQEAL